jgi:hypothetical protein
VRAILGVRRWRHNPLRRATDRHEAWLALVALLLMLLAAPALGWAGGSLTDEALLRTVRDQHAERHATTAVVVSPAAGPPRFGNDPEAPVAERAAHTWVSATWRAPDGTARKGTVSTASKDTAPGSRVRIWTDDEGHPAPRPMDLPTAHTHAVLAGIGVSLIAAGLIEAARRIVVWRMMQRRYIRLDRAWAKAGPDWGRTGTGC